MATGLLLAPALLLFPVANALPDNAVAPRSNANVFMSEDFRTLGNWVPYNLFKQNRETVYTLDIRDGVQCVQAQSDCSASALAYKKEFDIYKYPVVKWKWMVGNIYPNGDLTKKSTNDSPARLYILFKYDPEKAGFFTRLKYSIAKKMYGIYPPGSNLCYVWANHPHKERIFTSPAWKYSKDIVLEAGPGHTNEWREEEVNILDDYRAAFGKDPPHMAAIAIMDNSNNAKGKSNSWFGPIEIFGPAGVSNTSQAGK